MKISSPFYHVLIVSYFAFCGVWIASANEQKANTCNKDTQILINDISNRGAGVVLAELYSDPECWNSTLKKIAAGTETWLKIAVLLHPFSDAGASEMLTLAVGEALENNPENVFRIALQEYRLEYICSGPDVDDVRYSSYQLSMKAIKRRQDHVKNISTRGYNKVAKECIRLLEESKSGMAEYFEERKGQQ